MELIQDLEFPAACHRMKATPDGQFLFATGIHAPRLRVYELGQLSMKFERHFDAEIVDFQVCWGNAGVCWEQYAGGSSAGEGRLPGGRGRGGYMGAG